METQTEIWKDVPGTNKRYQVSNIGRARSFIKPRNQLYEFGYRPNMGRIVSCLNTVGYMVINISLNGVHKRYLLHRLVALTFIPNPNNYPHINHLDGNRRNNCVENLEWCTHKMNMQHAFRTGLVKVPTGVHTHNAKLNSDQVKQIILLHKKGFTHRKLSELYPISHRGIGRICQGLAYKESY